MSLIDPGLLKDLRCPEDRSPLSAAETDVVDRLNRLVQEGKLKDKIGRPVKTPLDGGLIREDRRIVYPIFDGIPVLLTDEGIPLEQAEEASRGGKSG